MQKIKKKYSRILVLFGLIFIVFGLSIKKIVTIIIDRSLETVPQISGFLNFFMYFMIITGFLLIINNFYLFYVTKFVKKNYKEILLFIIILLICLVFVDVVLRSLNKSNLQKERIIETIEYKTSIKLNSDLFRDQEFSKNKDNTTLRILMIGDSFVYGATVNKNESFEVLLETNLSNQFKEEGGKYKNVEIFNLGSPGANTRGYLKNYKKFKSYDYELVILVLYTDNDFTNYDVGLDKFYKIYNFIDNHFIKNIRKEINSLFYSKSIEQICEKYKERLTEEYFNLCKNNSVSWALIKKFGQFEDYNEYYNQIADNFNKKSAVRNHLLEMKELIEKEDKLLQVFIIPSKYQVSDLHFNDLEKMGFRASEEILENRRIQDELVVWCINNEIDCYDILPFFKENPEISYYNTLDDHLNIEGNKMVAEYIKKKINLINYTQSIYIGWP